MPLENESFAQAQGPPISSYGTLLGGCPAISACTQKCYDQWDAGLSRECPSRFGPGFTGFPRSRGLSETVVLAVTSVCPAWSLDCKTVVLCLQVRLFSRTRTGLSRKKPKSESVIAWITITY